MVTDSVQQPIFRICDIWARRFLSKALVAASAARVNLLLGEPEYSTAMIVVFLNHSADSITVSIEDEKIREIIPLDHITVPYRAHGVPLSAGETIDSGAQLAINISNFDLLRIGVNPLQPLHTGSEAVNREWMRFLIHTLFEHSYQDEAKLWIREYNPAQYRQLFLWEE